jgi:transposase
MCQKCTEGDLDHGWQVLIRLRLLMPVNPKIGTQAGLVVREGVVGSDPEAISVCVKAKAPDAVRIGLETGRTSTWLRTDLKRLVGPVICIDARHAKAVLKMKINKSPL